MEQIRVYELAKKYGLTNKRMMEFLKDNNISVNSYMSILRINDIKSIISKLETSNITKEHINRTALQRIKIDKLFGKYDYDIQFKNDINIWVARNGRGKTTILNLIASILTGDLKTLIETNFSKLHVWIRDKEFIFDKNNPKKRIYAKDYEYVKMMLDQYDEKKFYIKNILDKNDVYSSIFAKMDEYNFWPLLKNIQELISEESLYYPTYRRIEASIEKIFEDYSKQNEYKMTKYINFGMTDVIRRIDDLLDKMREDANNSYLIMNGEIISDLLSDSPNLYRRDFNIDSHKLKIVIKRIGEDRIKNLHLLEKFIEDENQKQDFRSEFLKFYLYKLLEIYDGQKAIDKKLREFANVCSKYLSEKKVVYDEAMLSFVIKNEDDEDIGFEDLSSGEKQIISIFSKVYLDVTTSCIFLIDEPELSLSIEWQREFLKDIYHSGKVGLLIATTHSPFIFKNEFREFTYEMDIFRKG